MELIGTSVQCNIVILVCCKVFKNDHYHVIIPYIANFSDPSSTLLPGINNPDFGFKYKNNLNTFASPQKTAPILAVHPSFRHYFLLFPRSQVLVILVQHFYRIFL